MNEPDLVAVDLAVVARRLASAKLKLLTMLVLSALVAALIAFDVDLGSMDLRPREFGYGAASVQIALDAERSPLRDATAELEPLITRAQLYAALLRSDRVRVALARRLGTRPDDVALLSGNPGNPKSQAAATGPVERRGNTLRFQGASYRMVVAPLVGLPVIAVNILAPTGEEAQRAAAAVTDEFPDLIREGAGVRARGVIATPVGTPVASEVVPSSAVPVAAAAFLGTFVLLVLAWLFVANVIEGLQRTARDE